MSKIKKAVYAGSFDPLTNGHMWVIEQGVQLFDELIVAIGENPDKKYTFSLDDRLDMLTKSLEKFGSTVSITHFTNRYLVDFAIEQNAQFMLRGIRNSQDFEYEKVLRHVNADIVAPYRSTAANVTTYYVIPPRELSEISSSFAKALCGPTGWERIVQKYVPQPVFLALLKSQIKKNQPR
jgi:pantetheine-phosphate adenylyltransferase